MERSPSSASTCLARARRERGQKRVPLPPASITGRKSIDSNMVETSYLTKTAVAQRCTDYFTRAEGARFEPPVRMRRETRRAGPARIPIPQYESFPTRCSESHRRWIADFHLGWTGKYEGAMPRPARML